jgi:hypothetical protein
VLRRALARLLPECRTSIVVIDNSLPPATPDRAAGDLTLVAGDNANREFSGWDRGLRWLAEHGRPSPNDVVVLANDTFHRSYGTEYLELFQPGATGQALRRDALLGYMDAYPQPVTLLGYRVRSWIRTSFLVTTLRAIRTVQPLRVGEVDRLVFSSAPGEFFRRDAPLCPRYQGYLRTWLFGDGQGPDGFGERWHSQAALTAANLEQMRAKARCILAEHSLSARARLLGLPVVDVRGVEYEE